MPRRGAQSGCVVDQGPNPTADDHTADECVRKPHLGPGGWESVDPTAFRRGYGDVRMLSVGAKGTERRREGEDGERCEKSEDQKDAVRGGDADAGACGGVARGRGDGGVLHREAQRGAGHTIHLRATHKKDIREGKKEMKTVNLIF